MLAFGYYEISPRWEQCACDAKGVRGALADEFVDQDRRYLSHYWLWHSIVRYHHVSTVAEDTHAVRTMVGSIDGSRRVAKGEEWLLWCLRLRYWKLLGLLWTRCKGRGSAMQSRKPEA